MKTLALAFLLFSGVWCHADGSLVQICTNQNGTFFPTTTVGCTLPNPVAANHLLIITGFSCRNTCLAVGAQSTHSMSDTLGLSIINVTYTLQFNTGGGGNWSADSIWYAETGASTGTETVTLTLNTSAGNGIVVMEWAGLATSSPITGSGSPSVVQHFFAGGGSPPILFTGGTITMNGIPNVATVLADLNGASDWLIQFVGFKALAGHNLLFIYGDCDNCGGLFQNLPGGYTKQAQSIGDNDSVYMTSNALNPSGVLRPKGWIF